jgi:predicted MPP superfamily phosphohydrolase
VHAVGVLLVVIAGAAAGAALAPSTTADVGPIEAQVSVVPSLSPGVRLLLPPAGEVAFDTHLAPFAVRASISRVDLEGARALINSPAALRALQGQAPDSLRDATIRAAATTALCALTGALVLSLLVYRRHWSRTGEVAAMLGLVLVVVAGTGVLTFDADKLAQPRFTGLLGQAPYVAGKASSMLTRLESYRSGLADIVSGVTTLYATSDSLPVLPAADDVVTVLHVSDVHLNPLGFDLTARLVKQFHADLVVDTGDITSWGTEVESSILARVGDAGVPYVFVRGNHDSLRTQAAVARNANAIVLDGRAVTVKGVTIAGIGDPRFTPDSAAPINDPTPSDSPVSSGSRSPTATPTLPASLPGVAASAAGAGESAGPSASATSFAESPDPEVRAGARLADVVQGWNDLHPDAPVAIAAVHEPYAVPPLLGHVPLVLAGHFHERSVRLDPSGTRVMVEGSTGGAGLTSDTMHRVAEGQPVPLKATLIYVARRGPRAGQVVAYDEVTVGGFGLASVTLDRTVVRPGTEAILAPGQEGPPPQPSPEPEVTGGSGGTGAQPSTVRPAAGRSPG